MIIFGVGIVNAQPVVNINVLNTTTTTVTAAFTPNADCSSYYIYMGEEAETAQWAQMMTCSVSDLVQQWGIFCPLDTIYTWTEQIPATEYTIYALAIGGSGNELFTQVVSTNSAGGEGESVITIVVTDVTETSARVICTPNDETAVFYDGIVTKEFYDEVGQDSVKQIIKNGYYPQYEVDNWVWMGLTSNTAYYALAIGKNANDIWGEMAIESFSTLEPTSINNMESDTFTCYPNPADNYINVSTTFRTEKAEVFNLLGQVVYSETVSGNNFTVNVSGLAPGTYILRLSNAETFTTKMIVRE